MRRRLSLVVVLLSGFALLCAGAALVHPVRSQPSGEAGAVVIPAGDSMALALAILRANEAAALDRTASTTIYLSGGVYSFSYPGSPSAPQFPPITGTLVLQGGDAVLDFSGAAGMSLPIVVLPEATVTIQHTTLRLTQGYGRTILNQGHLSLIDSTLVNTSATTTGEGGGIDNRGALTLTRVQMRDHVSHSAAAPGGAILNSGVLTAACTLFSGNHASQGGALYNAEGGEATITGATFSGNTANGGGAMFNADSRPIMATESYWGGQSPVINDLYFGTDTISQRVEVFPLAEGDPLSNAACVTSPPSPPPIPTTPAASGQAVVVPPLNFSPFPLAYQPGGQSFTILKPNTTTEMLDLPAPLGAPVWSPDGRFIAFASYASGNADIWVRDTLTGMDTNLTTSPTLGEGSPQWSPDGTRLVVVQTILTPPTVSHRLGILAAADGQVTTLNVPVGVEVRSPSWSADGTEIFYRAAEVWNDFTIGSIVAVPISGTGAERVVIPAGNIPVEGGYLTAPIFVYASPTRPEIVFSARYWYTHPIYGLRQNTRLFVANNDGSTIRLLLTGTATKIAFSGVWSPDGNQVAFSDYFASTMQVIRRDGTGEILLAGVYVSNLGWVTLFAQQATPTPTLVAPPQDRTDWVVYASFDNDNNYELYMLNARTTASPIRLTYHAADDYQPSWSPDKRYIAFISTRDNSEGDLYILDVVDPNHPVYRLTTPTQPTGAATAKAEPVWSPDGLSIAFRVSTAEVDSADLWLYTQVAGEAHYHPLVTTPGNDYAPTWSALNQIAFVSNQDERPAIWVIDISGIVPQNRRVLVNAQQPIIDPAWSPDGTKIGFTAQLPNDQYQIFVYAVGQGTSIPVTSTNYKAAKPTWSPDGVSLVFMVDNGQVKDLYLAKVDGSEATSPTRLTNGTRNIHPFWSSAQRIELPPTPSSTPHPPLSCQITLINKRYGFDQWFDADTHGASAQKPTQTSQWVEISPALGNAGPYLVLQKYVTSNLVQIDYPSRPLWIDSSEVSPVGDCATGYPTAIPTLTPIPSGDIPLGVAACEGVLGGIRLTSGRIMDYADCRAINPTLADIPLYDERRELGRLLWLLEYGRSAGNSVEFGIRIEAFFCVELIESSLLDYQHLNDIFLALLQTNYAFLKAEPTLGGVHQTSCAIFGQPGNALRFERVDALGASGEAAKAEGNTIFLYNTAKNRNRHTAANMIHEIGHYINAKLGGAILDGIPNLNSPLGQLRDGKLKLANGTDFSGQIVALDKARDGMQPDPYTQNGGGTCGGDISCARNEEFADMFLHWVYEKATGGIFLNDKEDKGNLRRQFMDTNMSPGRPKWVCQLANYAASACQ